MYAGVRAVPVTRTGARDGDTVECPVVSRDMTRTGRRAEKPDGNVRRKGRPTPPRDPAAGDGTTGRGG